MDLLRYGSGHSSIEVSRASWEQTFPKEVMRNNDC